MTRSTPHPFLSCALRTAALAVALALSACRPAAGPETAQAPDGTGATPAPTPAPGGAGGTAPGTADAAPTHPSLRVASLEHGTYDLADRRGKWVVVNFWATWCAPCLKEMPELSALDAMNEHIEVVGLAYEEIEPAAMRTFLQAHPVTYPVAIVDVYDPPADFETPRGLPMTYLVDPDGRIAAHFLGPVTAADIEQAIAKAGGG